MGELITTPNLSAPDDVYQLLIDLCADCGEATSHKRNAKLILTLANQIGDEAIIAEAASVARRVPTEGET